MIRFPERDVVQVDVRVALRRLDQARREVNADDMGSVPGEETGQVALAAAGVKDLAAGNVARETEQTAGEPGQEATSVPSRTRLT
ncbi:MAG: hypothetical protein OXP73_15020 [Chloroflexota bacterium]|nr:hypothetical protein [Chloroflexota bacterium]